MRPSATCLVRGNVGRVGYVNHVTFGEIASDVDSLLEVRARTAVCSAPRWRVQQRTRPCRVPCRGLRVLAMRRVRACAGLAILFCRWHCGDSGCLCSGGRHGRRRRNGGGGGRTFLVHDDGVSSCVVGSAGPRGSRPRTQQSDGPSGTRCSGTETSLRASGRVSRDGPAGRAIVFRLLARRERPQQENDSAARVREGARWGGRAGTARGRGAGWWRTPREARDVARQRRRRRTPTPLHPGHRAYKGGITHNTPSSRKPTHPASVPCHAISTGSMPLACKRPR